MSTILIIASHRTDTSSQISPFNELFIKKIAKNNKVVVFYPRNFSFKRKLYKRNAFGAYDVIEGSVYYKPNRMDSYFLELVNKLSSFISVLYLRKVMGIKIGLVHQIGYFTEIGYNISLQLQVKFVLQIIGSDIGNTELYVKKDRSNVFLTANAQYSLNFFNFQPSAVIYRGLDVNNPIYHFQPKAEPNDPIEILYAGGFPVKYHELEGVRKYDYKGGVSLLEILSRLGGFKLHLSGPNIAQYKNQYQSLIHESKVAEYDYLSHTDLLALMSKTDIVVIPSYSEGVSNVAMEGMFLQKTVIARRVGGMPELITHEYNGILFDTNEELYEILNELIGAHALRNKERLIFLGQNARKTISERFNNADMIRSYNELYRQQMA
ncbi:MAG: glycosyltransferase family 4 protein [Bacteroidota bacterium]